MATKRSGLTGITVFSANAKRVKAQIKDDLYKAVEKRTRSLHDDIDAAMEGKYPGRHTSKVLAGSPTGSSGLDVPGTSLELGMIGEFSGRMRKALKQEVVMTKNGPKGYVGFGKNIRSFGGAATNALDWPKKQATINPVYTLYQRPEDDLRVQTGETPEEYIPKVLLGTKKHVGRNILRLALYEDINHNTSLKTIEEYLKSSIRDL